MRLHAKVTASERFDAASAEMIAKLASAMHEEGKAILEESQADYVPVVTGELRASGFVNAPEITGGRIRVRIGYGRRDSKAQAYAIGVHEADTTRPGRKYLSKPLRRRSRELTSRIAKLIR